jgi:hypothetical protein
VTEIGPVQIISFGFEPNASFEGRVLEELSKLESERTIRVLDLLFIARDADSDEVVVLEHQGGESLGAILGALLGFEFEGEAPQPEAGGGEGHAFGLTRDDLEQMAAGLPPGGSAALLLIEHVWARGLKKAIRDVGGHPLAEGFLTPETIAAVAVELAAMSEAIEELEREGATA